MTGAYITITLPRPAPRLRNNGFNHFGSLSIWGTDPLFTHLATSYQEAGLYWVEFADGTRTLAYVCRSASSLPIEKQRFGFDF